jgi:hypothetical protein
MTLHTWWNSWLYVGAGFLNVVSLNANRSEERAFYDVCVQCVVLVVLGIRFQVNGGYENALISFGLSRTGHVPCSMPAKRSSDHGFVQFLWCYVFQVEQLMVREE